MKANPQTIFLLACGFWLALVGAGPLRAEVAGMSGDYDDAGVIAAGAPEQFPLGVSLHALISLEFDPGLTHQLHEQVDRVRVRYENGLLTVKVLNHNGDVCRQGRWKKDPRDGHLSLVFRVNDDNYLFQFETVGEQRLLQVTVQHSTPTSFGPNWHDVGTFLFPRIR